MPVLPGDGLEVESACLHRMSALLGETARQARMQAEAAGRIDGQIVNTRGWEGSAAAARQQLAAAQRRLNTAATNLDGLKGQVDGRIPLARIAESGAVDLKTSFYNWTPFDNTRNDPFEPANRRYNGWDDAVDPRNWRDPNDPRNYGDVDENGRPRTRPKTDVSVGWNPTFWDGSAFSQSASGDVGWADGSAEQSALHAEAGGEFGWGSGGPQANLNASGYVYGANADGTLGNDNVGVTGSAGGEVLGADAHVGLDDYSAGAGVGVDLASAQGSAGVNVGGVNASVSAEAGLKAELGFSFGKHTEIKLPLVSIGFDIGW